MLGLLFTLCKTEFVVIKFRTDSMCVQYNVRTIHVVERFLVARLYTYRWSSVHKTISYAQIGSMQKVLFIELIVANWNPFDLL